MRARHGLRSAFVAAKDAAGVAEGGRAPQRDVAIDAVHAAEAVLALCVIAGLAWITMRAVAASPGFSDSGESIWSKIALLCTVALLASIGVVHRLVRPANRFGWLLIVLAGLLLATEWDLPGATAAGSLSAAMFSVGLLVTLTVPLATTWAVLAFPSGQLGSRAERYLLAAGVLVLVGGLGLVSAVFFDPQAHGCPDCPTNLLLLQDDPDVAAAASRLAMATALAWAAITVITILVGLARMSPASRRARGVVSTIGVLYLVAVSAQLVLGLDRGFAGGPAADHRLWLAQLGGLAALAIAVAFSLLRSRAMRRSVAGLVVDLHREAAAGGMREALATWLHDPWLQVGYRIDGTYRDVDLATVDVTARSGRATSRLMDEDVEIAVLVHRPGLLDNPDAVQEVLTAARLGLENERLRAEGLAQVRALADSRVRIIEAGDRERRRLERDLHDGAQQRLVALQLGVRLLRDSLAGGPPEVEKTLEAAEAEVRGTVRDLRELATGLFPNILVTEGLGGACEALSETTSLRVMDLPGRRLPAAVETTAYLVIATAAGCGPTTVRAAYGGGCLRIRADVADALAGIAGLDDRVAALGGRIMVARVDGGSRVDLELPLALGVSAPVEGADGVGI